MSKIEAIVVGAVAGIAVVVCAFVAGWWLGFGVLPDKFVPAAAFTGLGIGLLLDAMFLPRWVRTVYHGNLALPIGVYLFSALILFAFCMGVPLLHPVLGVVAGAYIGRRLRHSHANPMRLDHTIRHASLFTAAVMFAICGLSATIALVNPSTPSDLQRMFGLDAAPHCGMILALIVAGGSALVLLQYWLTRKAATFTFRLGGENPLNPES